MLRHAVALMLVGCDDKPPTTDSTDTESTDTDTDTGEPGTTPPEPLVLDGLTYRLDPQLETLVYVGWNQSLPATVHVEYAVDPGEWRSTPAVAYEAGTHERLVVGIPFDEDAEWRVVADDGTTADGELVVTGAIPDGIPSATVTVSEPDGWLPSEFLLMSINARANGWAGGAYWTLIIDRQGRVVWAHRAPDEAWTLFAQVGVEGDRILWDEQRYWSDFYSEGAYSKVHATWLDGEIEVIDTPGLHHAFVQLPDGTLAWGSQAHGGREALVEKAPGETEVVLWTCEDDWPGSGSCESNGLFYQPSSNTFLYSFYTNSSIVEIDRATGTSLWWAGGMDDGYTFAEPDDQFYWQHGISWTPSGTLLMSADNNDDTKLMEFEVDKDQQQLTLVFSSPSGLVAGTNGQAWRLTNGNTLHLVGAGGLVREVDPAGAEVWVVDFGYNHLIGHGQLLPDLYALVAPD
ncbi:MAG: hypothetical protein ABMA64_30215 [Myxococcota bacterium]